MIKSKALIIISTIKFFISPVKRSTGYNCACLRVLYQEHNSLKQGQIVF